MLNRLIPTSLICLLVCSIGYGQKRTKSRAQKPAQSQATIVDYDRYPFVTPIEVRIGYHRLSQPALFVKLKNDGSRLTVKSITASIMAIDPIRIKVLKSFITNFDFAVPITPGGIFDSVVTAEEYNALKDRDIVATTCKNYTADKDEPNVFTPSECLSGRDALLIEIHAIHYTNGEKWVPVRSK